MADPYDKYPSFIASATKTKKNDGTTRHRKAHLTQSETKAEINHRKLYKGDSIFLEELCSLPIAQRAAEAVMEMKKGNSLFGSLGAVAATVGLFVAKVAASPFKLATSVAVKTSPTATAYVDAAAAVLLESTETAIPVIGSDPVKVAKRLKYRSVKTMYDGARCLVKSQVGQCALGTVDTLVEGAEVMLAYVAPQDPCAETAQEPGDGLRTEEESGYHKSTQTPVTPKRGMPSLICLMLTLPLRTALFVAKPIQRTMVYFAKNRLYRKTRRTPSRNTTRTARKSLGRRPRASPIKRASKQDRPQFYRRLVTSLLVTLKITDPPPPPPPPAADATAELPEFVFDPNILCAPKHKFLKRSYDDMDSDDGTLSDIMGDLEDYCSDEDPNYEWDYSYMGEEDDSLEYMTDSFSDLENELDFLDKEADTNILGGRIRAARQYHKKVTAISADTKTGKKCSETIEMNTNTTATSDMVTKRRTTFTKTGAKPMKTSTTAPKMNSTVIETSAAASKTSTRPTETTAESKKKSVATTKIPTKATTTGDKTDKGDSNDNNAETAAAPLSKNAELPPLE